MSDDGHTYRFANFSGPYFETKRLRELESYRVLATESDTDGGVLIEVEEMPEVKRVVSLMSEVDNAAKDIIANRLGLTRGEIEIEVEYNYV